MYEYGNLEDIKIGSVVESQQTTSLRTNGKLYIAIDINTTRDIIKFTNDKNEICESYIRTGEWKLVKTKPLSGASDIAGKQVIIVSSNEYPLRYGLSIADVTTYTADGRFHTNDARILCRANETFKAGDMVRFKDPTSGNAVYFNHGFENLKVKSTIETGNAISVYESNESDAWLVQPQELEHIPTNCTVTHTADDSIYTQAEFTAGRSPEKLPSDIKELRQENTALEQTKTRSVKESRSTVKLYNDPVEMPGIKSLQSMWNDLTTKKKTEMSNQSTKINVNGKSIDLCNETEAKKIKTGFQSRSKYTITTYTPRSDRGQVYYAHSKKNAKLLANAYLQDAKSGAKVTIAKEMSAIKRKDAPLVDC